MTGKFSLRGFSTRPGWLAGGVVFLATLLFAAYTQHGWEDYWITFRASKNLAMGLGLVFTPGERLHTFTSPLGVLLPAALSWLTGNHSDALAFWLFRIVSAAALASGVVLLMFTLRALRLRAMACWVTLGCIAWDTKVVDFSINGMETGLLVFFTALAIHGLLVAGPRQVLRIGLGWAGMMWTRPDSCVYIAVLAAGSWLFLADTTVAKPRLAGAKQLLLGAGVCALVYLPWFLWAWWYYGTPVPHTITAKGAGQPPLHAAALVLSLLKFPLKLFTSSEVSLPFAFMPVYADHGGWPPAYLLLACLAGWTAAFLWVIPVVRPAARMFSLGFFAGNFYLTEVLSYFPPWYLPMVGLFGYLALGVLFDQVLGRAERLPAFGTVRVARLLGIAAVALVLGQLGVLVCSARQLQVQQALIENGLRTPIGRWLREQALTPHDSVMLEPLGYIGYYSGLKMYDYPGLASREMVETRKRLGPARKNRVYLELKPDWLVLRPNEAKNGTYVDVEGLQKNYELVRTFDASEQIRATRWLPGRPYLEYDQTFLVFHRKSDATFQ